MAAYAPELVGVVTAVGLALAHQFLAQPEASRLLARVYVLYDIFGPEAEAAVPCAPVVHAYGARVTSARLWRSPGDAWDGRLVGALVAIGLMLHYHGTREDDAAQLVQRLMLAHSGDTAVRERRDLLASAEYQAFYSRVCLVYQ